MCRNTLSTNVSYLFFEKVGNLKIRTFVLFTSRLHISLRNCSRCKQFLRFVAFLKFRKHIVLSNTMGISPFLTKFFKEVARLLQIHFYVYHIYCNGVHIKPKRMEKLYGFFFLRHNCTCNHFYALSGTA